MLTVSWPLQFSISLIIQLKTHAYWFKRLIACRVPKVYLEIYALSDLEHIGA